MEAEVRSCSRLRRAADALCDQLLGRAARCALPATVALVVAAASPAPGHASFAGRNVPIAFSFGLGCVDDGTSLAVLRVDGTQSWLSACQDRWVRHPTWAPDGSGVLLEHRATYDFSASMDLTNPRRYRCP